MAFVSAEKKSLPIARNPEEASNCFKHQVAHEIPGFIYDAGHLGSVDATQRYEETAQMHGWGATGAKSAFVIGFDVDLGERSRIAACYGMFNHVLEPEYDRGWHNDVRGKGSREGTPSMIAYHAVFEGAVQVQFVPVVPGKDLRRGDRTHTLLRGQLQGGHVDPEFHQPLMYEDVIKAGQGVSFTLTGLGALEHNFTTPLGTGRVSQTTVVEPKPELLQ